MSFEFLVEKETEKRKLSNEEEGLVIKDISSMWDNWDDARSKQKDIAEKLRPEIYLDTRESKDRGDNNWKSDVHLNKIYSLFQTQQAYIWDNIYSNIENMFDVQGKDQLSNNNAKAQKMNLVNIFYKNGIQRKLDRAIEYLGSVGEFCLFIGWKTQYKQVRKKLAFGEVAPDGVLYQTSNYVTLNKEIYNGASIEAIDPINLVFDPKISPEDAEKWDSCGKIIKDWQTYDSIASNKLFKLSKKQLEAIKKQLNQSNDDDDEPTTAKTDDVVQGNRIEVLQYWGNYTLPDGTVLRNWNIVIIGRSYLALFEHNRWIINPIINMAIFRDIKSKRGIPEIWSIYDLSKEQEKKVNLQNDAQSLNLNPPAYAPKGFFMDKNISVSPGKQIEYKAGLDDPNAIIKMTFPLFDNETIINYYDSTASTVSGIFPNMQGQSETKDATATEINVKVQGQTTRLAKTLDNIKQNGIVPMVTKVAELDANMKFGDEELYAIINGQPVTQTIGDMVRQGNYEYKYTDSNGLYRKAAKNKELVELLANVWNDPNVPLNKTEIVKDVLKNADFEDTDKYFLTPQQQMPVNPMPNQQMPIQPQIPEVVNE